ncbi:hypothetical protein BBJ28_00021080 [Nothophytophthora sp. Chile5]|nr:hypothetical protein BBJ28_00021080 [Nothophytophthora sp. Chile5]
MGHGRDVRPVTVKPIAAKNTSKEPMKHAAGARGSGGRRGPSQDPVRQSAPPKDRNDYETDRRTSSMEKLPVQRSSSYVHAASAWATNKTEVLAMTGAFQELLTKLGGDVHFVVVGFSTGFSAEVIVNLLRQLAPGVPYIGGTIARGMCDENAWVSVNRHNDEGLITLWGVNDPHGIYSVVHAEYSQSDAHEKTFAAAKTALTRVSADIDTGEKPAFIAVYACPLFVEHAIDGIREAIHCPIIGGCSSDATKHGEGEVSVSWIQISSSSSSDYTKSVRDGRGDWTEMGVAFALCFPSVETYVSWFSGYSPVGVNSEYCMGMVTKASNKTIYEIDSKPAAEVYQEWLDVASDKSQTELSSIGFPRLGSLHPLGTTIDFVSNQMEIDRGLDANSSSSLCSMQSSDWSKLINMTAVITGINEDGSLSTTSSVACGTNVVLMETSAQSLKTAINKMGAQAVESNKFYIHETIGCLMFLSAGVQALLGHKSMAEMASPDRCLAITEGEALALFFPSRRPQVQPRRHLVFLETLPLSIGAAVSQAVAVAAQLLEPVALSLPVSRPPAPLVKVLEREEEEKETESVNPQSRKTRREIFVPPSSKKKDKKRKSSRRASRRTSRSRSRSESKPKDRAKSPSPHPKDDSYNDKQATVEAAVATDPSLQETNGSAVLATAPVPIIAPLVSVAPSVAVASASEETDTKPKSVASSTSRSIAQEKLKPASKNQPTDIGASTIGVASGSVDLKKFKFGAIALKPDARAVKKKPMGFNALNGAKKPPLNGQETTKKRRREKLKEWREQKKVEEAEKFLAEEDAVPKQLWTMEDEEKRESPDERKKRVEEEARQRQRVQKVVEEVDPLDAYMAGLVDEAAINQSRANPAANVISQSEIEAKDKINIYGTFLPPDAAEQSGAVATAESFKQSTASSSAGIATETPEEREAREERELKEFMRAIKEQREKEAQEASNAALTATKAAGEIAAEGSAAEEDPMLKKDDTGRIYQGFEEDIIGEDSGLVDHRSALEILQEAQKKKEIKAVDHSKIKYLPFQKKFYVVPKEIKQMSEEEVEVQRKELEIKIRGKSCPRPLQKWTQCGFSVRMLQLIQKHGYTEPFAIQQQALPAIMSGRDVIGIAKTGSGKTLAFLLPMFRHILHQPPLQEGEGPIGIVMAPARELAQQIYVEARKFSKGLGLRATAVYGGSSVSEQIANLKRGSDIVICTPGRMIDILCMSAGKMVSLQRVTYVVLDEADRMFDMGFEPQITKIMLNIRPDRQTLLFSATFPRTVETLARKVLRKPVEITVGTRSTASGDITQYVEVREENDKFMRLLQLLGLWYEKGNILVFVNKQQACDQIFQDLMKAGYPALSLHGGKDQVDRDYTIDDFKRKVRTLMVATSVAGRGLDVKDLVLVINYHCPNHMEDYDGGAVDEDEAEEATTEAGAAEKQSGSSGTAAAAAPKPAPMDSGAMSAFIKAQKIIQNLDLQYKGGKGQDDGTSENHFVEELEINDYPQQARWKVTQKEASDSVAELTGVAVIARGSYVPAGRKPNPSERKLYLVRGCFCPALDVSAANSALARWYNVYQGRASTVAS